MPRDLWTWTVDPQLEVADLSSEDRLQRVGLAAPTPGRLTWPPYQRIGETLHREGWPGLLAPSADRPRDGLVLCLPRRPGLPTCPTGASASGGPSSADPAPGNDNLSITLNLSEHDC
jgi:hypothetical protein